MVFKRLRGLVTWSRCFNFFVFIAIYLTGHSSEHVCICGLVGVGNTKQISPERHVEKKQPWVTDEILQMGDTRRDLKKNKEI